MLNNHYEHFLNVLEATASIAVGDIVGYSFPLMSSAFMTID